jgi:two-component system osmolarity sensor histidine kinase EnvZ
MEAPMGPAELARAESDLAALERITGQFLVFAGAASDEPALPVPLEQLLAEAAAAVDDVPLELDLLPLVRRVRPTALARAVANLLDNARVHGCPPLRLVLRPGPPPGEGFEIEVWDHGVGIAPEAWERARQPFQRLDPSRGASGHCGLGLAIAERVARDHGGCLARLSAPSAFGIALRGRSLPPATVTSGHTPAVAGPESGGSPAHDGAG